MPPRSLLEPKATVPTTVKVSAGPRKRMRIDDPIGMWCLAAEVASMATSCGPVGARPDSRWTSPRSVTSAGMV